MLPGKLINLFEINHTHRYWHSTIVNAAKEAVVEELLPYKELFASVVPGQGHKLAAASCFRVYSSWSILL